MARKRIKMNKIKEIFRMHEANISQRKISKAVGTSRSVVQEYLSIHKKSKLRYSDIKNLSNDTLIELLNLKRDKKSSERYVKLKDLFPYFFLELKRVGVRLELLWQEYKQNYSNGYSYSRFCFHYNVWKNEQKISMHIEHKAGDKMFVDFTGKKLVISTLLGLEEIEVEIFLAVLGASQLTYAEALYSQKKEDWIKANRNAFHYFGGVSNAIVPDNLKSGVTKANKYEPDLNPEYADFAAYYGTFILPARPRKPQDKSLVEKTVSIIYTRIFARIRNEKFYSLEELNKKIWELLEEHNNKPMQQLKVSRRELFEQTEKHMLKPLPNKPYQLKKINTVTVQINYHVYVNHHRCYYSVPYRFRAKKVNVYSTETCVEIFYDNERIAFHKRNPAKRYVTNPEHMPSNHKFYADWNPERILSWAKKSGMRVEEICFLILKRNEHPEQNFKTCIGIINLEKKYKTKRLNAACKRAIFFGSLSYKSVKKILENKMDLLEEEPILFQRTPSHKNIRGKNYYEISLED